MGKVLTGPASKGGGSEYSDIEKLDSLSWKPSLPEDGTTLSFIGGLDSTEGGFFSLEEVSEVEYSFGISNNGIDNVKNAMAMPMNLGKRRRGGEDVYFKSDVEEIRYFQNGGKKPDIPKERKLKKKRIVEQCKVDSELTAELTADDDDDDGSEGEVGGFHAWDPLRLHPSLMKSIRRLGFKEPTAIQKACIPVASHQGKDMAGAAETGSGKTLAFGVPILQRLLEEGGGAACGHLRALIITPTRELALQVTDHIKEAARETGLRVVPIVGGMSAQKQERLLRGEPPIVIATPGRLWELMSEGKSFLTKLDYLSFFVLDEADRMIENGHFSELQSIIDMLPTPALQKKRRQTFVFSATIALSSDFRKKLKYRSTGPKAGGFSSIEALSARAGMRPDAAVVDLTSTSILASKLEESFIECREDDKDAYLYYILCVHGHGRKIVFCTSIAALRRISSLLRILGVCIWTLHAQMQQRARLKAIDRFRGNENGILVATDVAARGIDIPGVRAVVHYQLPHSADVYVHRSGRTARASSDGCSIALISSNDRSKFASLCRSLSKEDFRRFPLDGSYMPEVLRRLCVAQKIDRMSSKNLRVKAKEKWIERNAKMADLVLEREESDEERTEKARSGKGSMLQIEKLEKELRSLLSHPLRPKSMSRRFATGSGVSPVIQKQFMELVGQRRRGVDAVEHVGKLVVIGHDCTEPLEALRNDARSIVHFGTKNVRGNAKHVENRRKKKAEKKRLKDMRRKEKKCRESERSYY